MRRSASSSSSPPESRAPPAAPAAGRTTPGVRKLGAEGRVPGGCAEPSVSRFRRTLSVSSSAFNALGLARDGRPWLFQEHRALAGAEARTVKRPTTLVSVDVLRRDDLAAVRAHRSVLATDRDHDDRSVMRLHERAPLESIFSVPGNRAAGKATQAPPNIAAFSPLQRALASRTSRRRVFPPPSQLLAHCGGLWSSGHRSSTVSCFSVPDNKAAREACV